MTHAVGQPEKIRYPGGKDGWYRVECTEPGCPYSATEAYPGRAEKRVRDHAEAMTANEERVRRVQELRRSSAASPRPGKRRSDLPWTED